MNNFFQECPPLMSDRRWQTDYTSTSVRDHIIASINNIQRDDDYRHFLETFGQKIRDMQSKNDKAKFPCDTRVCVHDYNSKTTFYNNRKEFLKYNNVPLTPENFKCSEYPYLSNVADNTDHLNMQYPIKKGMPVLPTDLAKYFVKN